MALGSTPSRRRVGRRAFLAGLGLGGLGVALAACGQTASTPAPAATSAPAAKSGDATKLAASGAPAAGGAASPAAGGTTASGAAGTTAPAAKPAAAAPSGSGQKVTLQFVGAGNFPPEMDQLFADFNKANPNVTVEGQGVPIGEFYVKMETGYTSGSGPDVGSGGAGYLQYGYAGWTKDLTSTLEPAEKEDYFPVAMECVTYQGKVYALPFQSDAHVMWYRKDLMQQAGVDASKAPGTWDALLDYARKTTKKNGDTYDVAGILLDGSPSKMHQTYAFIYQNGGKLVEGDEKVYFDDPKTIEAVQWVADWGLKDGLAPKGGISEQVRGATFAAGKVAIHIYNPGAVSPAQQQGKDDQVGAWPMTKKERQATFAFQNAYYVNAKSKYGDESMKLLKFLASPDAIITRMRPSRQALPRKSAAAKADWLQNDRMRLVQEAAGSYGVNEGRSRYWIPIRDNIWTPALDKVYLGQATAQDACTQAAKEARDYLAKVEKK